MSGKERFGVSKTYVLHEVRYFYLGLAALGQQGGAVAGDCVDDVLRNELNKFNAVRSRRYNLRQREFSFKETPRLILYELRKCGLVGGSGRGSDKQWALTEEGYRLYAMLKNPANRLLLREEFAVLMLNTFPVFRALLIALGNSPYKELVGIPLLAPYEFDHFPAEAYNAAAETATTQAFGLMRIRFRCGEDMQTALRAILQTVLAKSIAERRAMGTIIKNTVPQFFIRHFFGDLFTSKAYYDLARTRSSFLGLINYFREGRPGAYTEIVYPVARLADEPVDEPGWRCRPLKSGYLLLRAPDWQEFTPTFLAALQRAYSMTPRSIGYVEVADLRDRVCSDLRLPDHIFDDLLQKAVQASQTGDLPIRVYLDSSLGDVMPIAKRAPLELKDKAFNLVRVQTTEGGNN